MSSSGTPRFDPDRLRALAGDKAFARGEGYADGGQVRVLAIAEDRVIAEAFGSDHYGLRLSGAGKTISGCCTCPAYDDAGFCKHLVAAGLITNALIDDGAEPDGALARITQHLAEMSKADVLAYVLTLADTNPALLKQLASGAGEDLREDGW
jgi:uncharacterized Zn finger protein